MKIGTPGAAIAAALGASVALLAEPGPAGKSVPEFGTANVMYYRIAAYEFSPLNDDSYLNGPNYDRHSTGFVADFVATPHLPDGALLTSVEFDYCDTSAGAALGLFVEDMLWNGTQQVGLDFLPSTPGIGCTYVYHNLAGLGYTFDNNLHQLNLRVVTSGAPTTSFVGVIVGYKLQVSPAPFLPTFGDVPTSSPQFQFVEALVHAGITAGCGGGNYCPDSPITRGQMAVFLAKALGLSWP